MAVAYQSEQHASVPAAGAANSLTVNVPGSVAVGDLLVAYICVSNAVSAEQIVNAGGWTQVLQSTAAGHAGCSCIGIFYRVADGTEAASYTWTTTNNHAWVGAIARYTGAKTVTPIIAGAVALQDTATTSHATGNLTTVDVDSMVVGFWGGRRNTSGVWGPPGTMTERLDLASGSNTTSDVQMCFDDEILNTPATIARTATTSTTTKSAEALIAIKPLTSGEDAATENLALTPSDTQAFVGADAATPRLSLTPGGSDVGPGTSAGTLNLKLTPSGSDIFGGVSGTTYLDTATELLKLTPSAVFTHGYADQATEDFKFTPFPVSLVIEDLATELFKLTPSATDHYCPQKVEFEGFLQSRWYAERRSRWAASEQGRWSAQFLGVGEGFAC